MKNQPILFFVLCLMVCIVACKPKSDEPAAPDRTELLTAKAWKLGRATFNGTEVNADFIKQFAGQSNLALVSLLYDSNILFKNDGTFTALNRSTSATTNGTWQFNADKTVVTMTYEGQTLDFTVNELTENSVKVNTRITVPVSGFPVSGTAALDLVPA